MQLTPSMNTFILHWGEMGSRWGVNRTIAQIHALLYLSADPLTAEEISETLLVARSNVSNSLRELQNWDLVKIVHLQGDRRDHYVTIQDVWEIFVTIGRQRFEREMAPTIAALEQIAGEASADKSTPPAARARIAAMATFTKNLNRWYTKSKDLPRNTLETLFKLAGKLTPADKGA